MTGRYRPFASWDGAHMQDLRLHGGEDLHHFLERNTVSPSTWDSGNISVSTHPAIWYSIYNNIPHDIWPTQILQACSLHTMKCSHYSDSLWAGQSGDRIPVGVGLRFSAHVWTGPGAHLASYTVGAGSFLWVKRPGCGIDHPPPSSAKVKGRVELYIYSLSRTFVACSRVSFTFTFTLKCHKLLWYKHKCTFLYTTPKVRHSRQWFPC